MKRIVGGVLIGLIMMFLTAQADPTFVGPEGDLYLVDSTAKTDQVPYPETYPSNLAVRTNPTDTVVISQLDCSMFPTMCMYVDVLDTAGYPVGGLTADSFCVSQDGSPIDSFSIQELTLDSCVTSIALVIDVSSSMNDNNKIAAARNAAHNFVNNMDIYDRVAIVTFSNCYTVVQNFTSNKTLLNSKINTISANGYTAAFDGIWKGVDITGLELGSKAVIAISDGMENYSQKCGDASTPDGLWIGDPPIWWWGGTPDPDGWTDDSTLIVGLAQSSGVPIYTISLGSDFDPQYLVKLAASTGGSYHHAPTGGDITNIYDEIKFRLCSRYLICYNSPDTVQNGDWHTITACRQDAMANCSPCDVDSCQEIDTPEITRTPVTVGLADTCARWDSGVEICTWVVDLDTPQEDLEVKLFYRNRDTVSYTSVVMNRTDSTYCYTIPGSALDCDADSIQYYITASDGHATVASPALAPTYHYSFPVCENQPPTVFAGNDTTLAQCSPGGICWNTSASDPDGNLQTVEKIIGPGTFDGTQICFTPTSSLDYEFVLRATDSCGLMAYDTVVVHYSLNHAPTADAGRDSTLFLCAPQEICWTAGCTDPDANLTDCNLISPVGTYSGGDICFTPDTAGVYRFILEAKDACNQTDRDTSFITVTFNSAPVCSIPNDTSIFQCTATQVSLLVSASDVDGNLNSCQIMSGPGSLIGGNWVYTPPSSQTVVVTIRCTDDCGAYCEDSFTVDFDIDAKPVISLGSDQTAFQCTPEEICIDYTVFDSDPGQAATITLLTSVGTVNTVDSTICFTPDTAGVYKFIAQAEDPCGRKGYDTVKVTVSFNAPPVANAGSDQTLMQCSPTAVTWAAACSDPDGNLATCELTSATGSYDGTNISFTPTASGTYEFILKATDACGLEDFDTSYVTINQNSAPVVTAQTDTSLFLCQQQPVCISYSVSDPDGLAGVVEAMVSGFGTIDTLNNEICFTPTSAGNYQFIIGATDGCSAHDQDTVIVSIAFGQEPNITCPTSAFNKFLCGPDSILQTLAITPDSATVTLSEGIYDGGMVRFFAGSEGTYNITVIAAVQCGADTCELTFNVDFNAPPVANAGSDQTVFQCTPAPITRAASCSDPDGNLSTCELISGVGTYNGSNITFTPTGTGVYEFVIKATDACGAEDVDTAYITVTANSAPTVVAQNDDSYFLCEPQQICVDYTPSDPDGLAGLTETMVSGYGAIDTVNNQICFTPTIDGDYEFIIEVEDACGVTDRDTVVISAAFGEVAHITCPTDTIFVSLCDNSQVCSMLDITPDSANVSVSLGTYSAGEHCFTPDTSGVYVVDVIADVQCGADTCQLIYKVDIGQAAEIVCPAPQTRFICQPGQVCIPISVVTPGATFDISPIGSYNAGSICFPADTSGHYVITVIATTSCGADTCEVTADVTINSNPVTVDPATPVDTFLCAAGQICYQFGAGDPDGGSLTWSKISGNGAITSGGNWCFNATMAGTYTISARVTDSCGAADTTTMTYNVTMNTAPVVDLGDDISVFLCGGNAYCFDYTLSDAENNIVLETLTSGAGSIDTLNNQICFTPTMADNYQFVVSATDACGATDADTIIVNVSLGSPMTITCPNDTAVFLCAPAQICRPVTIPIDTSVTVSPIGSYSAGEVCFDADTAGHYVITVQANSSCGSADCQFAVDVTMNSAPLAVDPAAVDTFLCDPQQICQQLEANDTDGGPLTWSRLDGSGTVDANGLWCFTASLTDGYSVTAVVTDPCGTADTVMATVNVTLNSDPNIAFGNDTTVFQCTSGQICLNYTLSDADGNIVLEELIEGAGIASIDTLNNTVCFTPTPKTPYMFIVRVTDACGAADVDTINVEADVNHPPVADAGDDQSFFLCETEQLCFDISCSDEDGNLSTCQLVGGVGAINGSQVCFEPDTSGVYTFIVEAKDECDEADRDTVQMTVTMNSAPVCITPADTSFFLCSPIEITRPVGANDVDGNFDHCEIVSGPGSITGGNWTHTPSAAGSIEVVVKCLDACGAFCQDTFNVDVEFNHPPVPFAGNDSTYFSCAPGDVICWDVSATDPDNNLKSFEMISSNGTYDPGQGQVCFTVPQFENTYKFIFRATDSCDVSVVDTALIQINLNAPPVVDLPDDFTAYFEDPTTICFDADISDPDGNLDSVTVSPVGEYSETTGQVCFYALETGTVCLEVAAYDDCGAVTRDTICVGLEIDECFRVQIEKVENQLQGHYASVDINLFGSAKELGGFDLLIAYDQSVLNMMGAVPGQLLTNCDWEYFTYSFGPFGNCGGGCPSGMLRVVGLAETNNGAYHPDCYLMGSIGSIAVLNFLVSNDRTVGCQVRSDTVRLARLRRQHLLLPRR